MCLLRRFGPGPVNKPAFLFFFVFLFQASAHCAEPPSQPDAASKARDILNLASEILPHLDESPDDSRKAAVRDVAVLYARIGGKTEAERLMIRADKEGQDAANAQLAIRAAKEGDFLTADSYLSRIQTGLSVSEACTGLGREAAGYSPFELNAKFDKLFEDHGIAQADGTLKVPEDALGSLNAAFANAAKGRQDWRAQDYFAKSLEAAEPLPAGREKNLGLESLITTESETGYLRLSFDAFQAVDDEKTRCKLLTKVTRNANPVELALLDTQVALLKVDSCRENVQAEKAARLEDLGETQESEKTLAGIEDPVEKTTAYLLIVERKIYEGDLNAAVRYLDLASRAARLVPSLGKKAQSLNRVGVAQMKAKQTENGRRSFQEARNAARHLERDFYEKASALIAVARSESEYGYAKDSLENLQEARRATLTLEKSKIERLLSLKELGEAFGVTGHAVEAKLAFDEAVTLASGWPDSIEKATLLIEIGAAEDAANDRPRALEVLAKASTATAEIEDEKKRVEIVSALAMQYVKIGVMEEAVRTIEAIPTELERGAVFYDLLAYHATQGETDESISIAYNHPINALRIRGLAGAARGLLAAASHEELAISSRYLLDSQMDRGQP